MAASSSPAPPRVFISYTHDSAEHADRVWELSERLRKNGVDCRVDLQEQSPAEGWPRWCRNQVQESQFVLTVCTETYQRRYEGNEAPGTGLGGQWEGFVITQELYDAQGRNVKFIPLVFSASDRQYIPLELRGATHYDLSQSNGYEELLRRLSGQPLRKASAIGEIPPLPPLERKAAPPKRLFTVPFRPNPFFTGREDALDGLKKTLEASGIAALTGMGGMGKTQTAAHYAHRHRKDYPFVLWVRAESADTLFADLTQLAQRLELPEREAKDQSVVVAAVERWLDGQERWLLVLDNVEDYGVVRELARKANENGHHVIITTQRQALGQIGRQRLAPMERDLGAVLLLRRAGRIPEDLKGRGFSRAVAGSSSSSFGLQPRPGLKPELNENSNEALYGTAEAVPLQSIDPSEAALAREISDEVGGLPLALDQAGAYIEETSCGLGDYLTLLRQRFDELAKRRGGLDADHISVAATFLTSLEKLAAQNPAAAELLNATAFLVPDAIPEEIFTEGAVQLGRVLQAVASDTLKWNEAIGAAFKFSLLGRNPEKKLLAVHRMVQAVARSRMSDEERVQWAERVVRAVNAVFPAVEFAVWDKCERLTPSAQACAALVDDYGLLFSEAAHLFHKAGWYLRERARHAEAEPLIRRSVRIFENVHGPDDPNVSAALNNLALLLQATNRMAEAEPLCRRALAIDEKSYGPDHPAVAISLNNLALLLRATNRLAEAEPLMRRVVQIFEKTHGQDHPNVAVSLNNLAELLRVTNRLPEAEPLYRRALAISETSLGPEHPTVAIRLNNLALLLQATNRLAEAGPLYWRALAIDEKSLGLDHPSVAIRLNNLALLLQDTNRLAEAEPLYRRALAIFEASLGPEHPDTIMARENLAALLRQKSSG